MRGVAALRRWRGTGSARSLGVLHGAAVGVADGVRLGRGRQVDRGLGEREEPLRHADEVDGLLGGDGDLERLRVGEPDVLGGEDDEAAGDEERVLAALEHAGEPVERGVGVGAAEGLDEGGDDVVVPVAGAVVERGAVLERLFDVGRRSTSRDAVGVRRRRLGGELERVQGDAGVAADDAGQRRQRVVRDFDAQRAEAALFVGERAAEEALDLLRRERLELEDAGAGEERRDDLERGVLGGGADEGDRAVLDVRQDDVLLGLVEAVDLVDEEDRALAVLAEALARPRRRRGAGRRRRRRRRRRARSGSWSSRR